MFRTRREPGLHDLFYHQSSILSVEKLPSTETRLLVVALAQEPWSWLPARLSSLITSQEESKDTQVSRYPVSTAHSAAQRMLSFTVSLTERQ